MKFQQPRHTGPVLSERQVLEQKFTRSRYDLLLLVAFTLLNIVMLLLKSDTYLLFAASIPYYLVFYGMLFTGKFPADWYGGEIEEYTIFNNTFFVITLILALVCLVFYVSFWYFSRKGGAGWLITALVFVVLDTVGMFLLVNFDPSMLLDVLFHGWIIFELAVGVSSAKRLKKLPPEEELPPMEDAVIPSESDESIDPSETSDDTSDQDK